MAVKHKHFHAVSDPAGWSCALAHPYATKADAVEYAAAVNEAGDCGSATVVPCGSATITDLTAPEYPGPGVGITDACGICHETFELMYPPDQYPAVVVEGEMPELICDACQDVMESEPATASEGYCPLPEHCGFPCRC